MERDKYHPFQALADVLTVKEKLGTFNLRLGHRPLANDEIFERRFHTLRFGLARKSAARRQMREALID